MMIWCAGSHGTFQIVCELATIIIYLISNVIWTQDSNKWNINLLTEKVEVLKMNKITPEKFNCFWGEGGGINKSF